MTIRPARKTTKKTAVSIPSALFDQAESFAAELGLSRSLLYANALEAHLSRLKQDKISAQLTEGYAEGDPEEEKSLEGILALHAEAVSDN